MDTDNQYVMMFICLDLKIRQNQRSCTIDKARTLLIDKAIAKNSAELAGEISDQIYWQILSNLLYRLNISAFNRPKLHRSIE